MRKTAQSIRLAEFLIVLLVLLAPVTVVADGLDLEEIRRLVRESRILPLEKILERSKLDRDVRLIEIELELKQGRYVYEIDVLRASGGIERVRVDAVTGRPIQGE